MPNYVPSLTLEQFHASNKRVRLILGAVGSGKSTGCIIECYTRALEMPVCIDGIRRCRVAIVRNTYPELKTTTLKTWQMWFPPRDREFNQAPPMCHTMDFIDDYGIRCVFEFYFLALDSERDVSKLLSLELTFVYFNEVREIPEIVFEMALTRIPRFPSAQMINHQHFWSGVIADTNAPNEDSWIVDRFFVNKNKYPDYELFLQPAPLIYNEDNELVENPLAENIEFLNGGYKYYWDMYKNLSEEAFNVYVLCKFGSTFNGLAVYSEYNDRVHRASYNIEIETDNTLLIGWDFGRTPAAALGQHINGQYRGVDEAFTKGSLGLEQFVEQIVIPKIAHVRGKVPIISPSDPSGVRRNDTDENYCIGVLNRYGFNAKPAPSNKPKIRIDAVRGFMNRMIHGQPAYLLSHKCRMLHEAKLGGYHYREIHNSVGQKKYSDDPDKNIYSHISDAEQYAMLYASSKDLTEKDRAPVPIRVKGQWIYLKR